jgi:hypothetical protein
MYIYIMMGKGVFNVMAVLSAYCIPIKISQFEVSKYSNLQYY